MLTNLFPASGTGDLVNVGREFFTQTVQVHTSNAQSQIIKLPMALVKTSFDPLTLYCSMEEFIYFCFDSECQPVVKWLMTVDGIIDTDLCIILWIQSFHIIIVLQTTCQTQWCNLTVWIGVESEKCLYKHWHKYCLLFCGDILYITI